MLFSCIFPLVLMRIFIFRNFLKMSIFCIFLLRSTLEWFWTFGARIFIFILSKLRQGCKKKKNTRIWRTNQYSYSKSWKNRPGNHISVNHKILPEGRYWRKAEGECFAPFLNFYSKLMFFLLLSCIFLSFDANLYFQKIFKSVNSLHFSITLHLEMILKKC